MQLHPSHLYPVHITSMTLASSYYRLHINSASFKIDAHAFCLVNFKFKMKVYKTKLGSETYHLRDIENPYRN
jgi:hypothetical protein